MTADRPVLDCESDFTRAEYQALLTLAGRTWRFRRFTDYDPAERFVLWRHDVDISLHSALALARIEAAIGVVATYFFLPHSDFYNLLEAENVRVARQIVSLGHAVGLHFDTHFYDIARAEDLEDPMAWERDMLVRLLGAPVEAVSFHNTTPFTMCCNSSAYAGMVNTYSKYFQRDVGYVSDSNGYWRHRRLRDVLEAGMDHRLQVLTHDAWWQEEPMTPAARVQRSIRGRADRTWERYRDLLQQGGRLNLGEGSLEQADGETR
jgi:hypothetical protein